MTGGIFSGTHDFFHSGTWDVIRNVTAVTLGVLWLATIFWVFKDARRRTGSRLLVCFYTLLGAVPPFLGPLIYMLFRPPEYLEDVRERELEIKAIERRLDVHECPVCRAEADPDFLVCPVCTTKLRQACVKCERPLEPSWQVCPYCETPIAGAEAPVSLRSTSWPRRTGKAR